MRSERNFRQWRSKKENLRSSYEKLRTKSLKLNNRPKQTDWSTCWSSLKYSLTLFCRKVRKVVFLTCLKMIQNPSVVNHQCRKGIRRSTHEEWRKATTARRWLVTKSLQGFRHNPRSLREANWEITSWTELTGSLACTRLGSMAFSLMKWGSARLFRQLGCSHFWGSSNTSMAIT